jgi:hypothetical protein
MTTVAKSYLPPEIISLIIAFVHSNSTLCNVALCSSLFYSLTVPVLYAHVELYSYHHGFKALRPLTVLFLTKPTLAQYVGRFTLRDPYEYYNFENIGTENRASAVNGVLREAVFANSHSEEEFGIWKGHVARDRPDALLAILLPTMVGLEKLDLILGCNWWQYFGRMLTRAVGHEKPFDKQPLFTRLTEFVHAASWDLLPAGGILHNPFVSRPWIPEPIGFDYNILFQNFPRVRSIYGHCLTDDNDHTDNYTINYNNRDCHGLAFACKSSSLTHFELKDSLVHPESLITILKIPNALSTFIYEISITNEPSGESFISPKDVLFALAPQHDSLENLWLDFVQYEAVTLCSGYVHDKSPLLSRFSCLKSLRVGAHVLLALLYYPDFDIPFRRTLSGLFPATLEVLHIIYRSDLVLWGELRGYILTDLNQVPRLKKIFIECDSDIEPPLDWKGIREHAASQGVDLISLISDRSQKTHFERGWGMDGSSSGLAA